MNKWLKITIIVVVLVACARGLVALMQYSDHSGPKAARAEAGAENQGGPHIQISPEARARLLQKIKAIEIGDGAEKVFEQLGRPGTVTDSTSTTRPVAPIPMRVGMTILSYYIRKKDRDVFVEDYDEHIHIFLDQEKRVKQIYIKLLDEQTHIFLDEDYNVQKVSARPQRGK